MNRSCGTFRVQRTANASIYPGELARRLFREDLTGKRVGALSGPGRMAGRPALEQPRARTSVAHAGDPRSARGVNAWEWRFSHAMGLINIPSTESLAPDSTLDALTRYGLAGSPLGRPRRGLESVDTVGLLLLGPEEVSGFDIERGEAASPAVHTAARVDLAPPRNGLRKQRALPWMGTLRLAGFGVPSAFRRQVGLRLKGLFVLQGILRLGSAPALPAGRLLARFAPGGTLRPTGSQPPQGSASDWSWSVTQRARRN